MNEKDFIDCVACWVFEDDFADYPEVFREIILRKLVKLGYVDVEGDYYKLKPEIRERLDPDDYLYLLDKVEVYHDRTDEC